jgi:hypothetical protein
VVDGLTRKEVYIDPVRVRRNEATAQKDDYIVHSTAEGRNEVQRRRNEAYVVSPPRNLRQSAGGSRVIVLLPDARFHWRTKEVRVVADELAFATCSTVIVPDTTRSDENERSKCDDSTRYDDVVAALQYVVTERGAKCVTLAGVGTGADLALEMACDLHDIGRLAQYTELETLYARTVGNNTFGNAPAHEISNLDLVMDRLLATQSEFDQACAERHPVVQCLELLCDADKGVFLRIAPATQNTVADPSDQGGPTVGPVHTGAEDQVTVPLGIDDVLERHNLIAKAEVSADLCLSDLICVQVT